MAPRPTGRAVALTAVAALGLPLALTACSGGTGGGVSTITVLDYYNNEPDNTIYQTALEACGKAENVTIERTAVPGSDLIAKVLQMASTKTLPDVLMIDNPEVAQIAESGALTPLSDLGVEPQGVPQGILDASTYDGKLYGLQPVTNTLALFYNTDLLKAAGVTPPTTWAELKETAAKLTAGNQYGVAFSAKPDYEGTWQFLPFMWSNGGDESNIDTPEMAQALQLWVDLVKSGSASESVVTWSQADVNDQFIAGNTAMMVNGPWQIPVLSEHPDLHWDVVPIPVPKAGMTAVAPFGGESWTVPNTGKKANQEIAAKIVTCLNSDDNEMTFATGRQTIPTRTSIQTEFASSNPTMATFSKLVQDARARTGKLGSKWPEAATKIYTALGSALVGGMSPEEALTQAANG